MDKKTTSTWFALRNSAFCRLWLASVLSGTFLSAQDVTSTWLINDLGASSFLLSLVATAASAPFFLFTLPAGALADIVNRLTVIVSAVLWQGTWSALLALGAWKEVINPGAVLFCIFALGIGIAFAAPVWGAVVPDIVSKDELPSAVTLGGVQANLSSIVGPALGGFLLPLLGAPLLISINASMFLVVALVVLQWKPRQKAGNQASGEFRGIIHEFAALCSQLPAHQDHPCQEPPLFARHFLRSGAPACNSAQGIATFRRPTWSCLHMRGRRVFGSGGLRAPVPRGSASRRMRSLRLRWR